MLETVTIQCYYYLPDHPLLLNWFLLQLSDEIPAYPKTRSFLDHWKNHIDAVLAEVLIAHAYQRNWKKLDYEFFT